NGNPPYRSPIFPMHYFNGAGGSWYYGRIYVTQAVGAPPAGALRITTIVQWGPAGTKAYAADRAGAASSITSSILVTSNPGTTDAAVGGAGAFYYGTGNISRGSVQVTANAGVA